MSRIGAQIYDVGIDRQAMIFNGASDIACHATRYRWIGTIGRLKFVLAHYPEFIAAVDGEAFFCGHLKCDRILHNF